MRGTKAKLFRRLVDEFALAPGTALSFYKHTKQAYRRGAALRGLMVAARKVGAFLQGAEHGGVHKS